MPVREKDVRGGLCQVARSGGAIPSGGGGLANPGKMLQLHLQLVLSTLRPSSAQRAFKISSTTCAGHEKTTWTHFFPCARCSLTADATSCQVLASDLCTFALISFHRGCFCGRCRASSCLYGWGSNISDAGHVCGQVHVSQVSVFLNLFFGASICL